MPASLYYGGKLIEGLTGGLTEALPFIHHLAEKALPANEILRQLAGAGYKIRRQAGLDVIRQVKDIAKKADYIKAVPNKYLPNPERLPYAVTDIRKNYSYKIQILGTDQVTGEKRDFYVTVASDNLIAKDEAMAIAYGYVAQNAENYNFEFADAVVKQLLRSPRLRAP